jgi:hypothetical protein
MPTWILIIILLSIGATALLASVLMRMNAPARQPEPKRDTRQRNDGSVASTGAGDGRGGKHDNDSSDAAGDGGGGGE